MVDCSSPTNLINVVLSCLSLRAEGVAILVANPSFFVILSPSPPVILSVAKNLLSLRAGSAKNLTPPSPVASGLVPDRGGDKLRHYNWLTPNS